MPQSGLDLVAGLEVSLSKVGQTLVERGQALQSLCVRLPTTRVALVIMPTPDLAIRLAAVEVAHPEAEQLASSHSSAEEPANDHPVPQAHERIAPWIFLALRMNDRQQPISLSGLQTDKALAAYGGGSLLDLLNYFD
ncbi:hypothetical protein ASG32_18980 [Methylobacterium sp. Leaf361]|nr:hypothetical protein ASG32_18980 [Methylobacterium sp. Leaf361]